MQSGDDLRKMRSRLKLTARAVEERSRRIAGARGNPEFAVSHARLTEIEKGETTPSLYKLFSLSTIYDVKIDELLRLYLPLDDLSKRRLLADAENTQLISVGPSQEEAPPELLGQSEASTLTEHVVKLLVPTVGGRPTVRELHYGFIGLKDYTLYPILRPGSLVLVDRRQCAIEDCRCQNESERPIYFVQIRGGYLCSWCEMEENKLRVLAHPASGRRGRSFAWPSQAEIVGRVMAVAAATAEVGRGPKKTMAAAAASAR